MLSELTAAGSPGTVAHQPEPTRPQARTRRAVCGRNQPGQPSVCNALKLSHFTAVKMSHPGRVVSSLFSEILIV
jgi:hypothetical protein